MAKRNIELTEDGKSWIDSSGKTHKFTSQMLASAISYNNGMKKGMAKYLGMELDEIEIPEDRGKRWIAAIADANLSKNSPIDAFRAGWQRAMFLVKNRPLWARIRAVVINRGRY